MLPWFICAGLAIIVIVLIIKIKIMQKSMKEICDCLTEHLSSDTNQLITVSSSDRYVRNLAARIAQELALLRRQRQQYINGDRELKEAITNISHDLRTPLTAIYGYLELLEREEKSETAERYLAQIQGRTDALKSLTEELFRYSVITSTQKLTPEHLDVKRVLEESLLSFYALMREKEILPEIDLPEAPVWRELDVGALNRIFSNIIGNAIKYSDGDLSVRMDQEGSIVFSNAAAELDPVTVGRLFDRFYTVEVNRSSTGLGLSIAKLLTEQMGGSIEARYRENRLLIMLKL